MRLGTQASLPAYKKAAQRSFFPCHSQCERGGKRNAARLFLQHAGKRAHPGYFHEPPALAPTVVWLHHSGSLRQHFFTGVIAQIFHHFGVHRFDFSEISASHQLEFVGRDIDAELRHPAFKFSDAFLRALQFNVVLDHGLGPQSAPGSNGHAEVKELAGARHTRIGTRLIIKPGVYLEANPIGEI